MGKCHSLSCARIRTDEENTLLNTIVIACEEGIFETEWDGEVFENKAGYETDNLYYLSPFSYQVFPGVYKGENGEYFTEIYCIYQNM